MILAFRCIFAMAVLSGIVLYRKLRSLERFERTIASTMPTLMALFAIAVVELILAAPYELLNEMRITRTFALFSGVNLYPGNDATGAIVGTPHPPVSHILYWPTVFAKTPTLAIEIGSAISFTLFFAPVVWLHFCRGLDERRGFLLPCFALLTFGFMMLQGAGMRMCAFRIHTDAAAICFATIGAGILSRVDGSHGWGRLFLSSVFAVLSVGCKQTMAPLLFALCLFVLLVGGIRPALQYMACVLASGIAFSSAIVAIFWPPKDLLFNLVTLASHRPSWGSYTQIHLEIYEEALLPMLALMLFGLHWYFYERSPASGWRSLLAGHRWLVFPLIGILLAPVCVKARSTYGGEPNHIGLFVYFFALGTTLGLSQLMTETTENPYRAKASRILALSLILASLGARSLAVFRQGAVRDNRSSRTWEAYEYDLRHPGRAYFPWNPLASVFVEHKFYHIESALQDREAAGHGINQAQFVSGIPAHLSLVATPFDILAFDPDSPPRRALAEFLSSWKRIDDPELPGWTVYQRPDVAPATQ
jgi:hypothetical protein